MDYKQSPIRPWDKQHALKGGSNTGGWSPSPSKIFGDADDGFDIVSSQERKDVYISGVLQQIIVRATVESATIRNVPYNCQIIGDGEVQHFGIDIPNSPPCTIYVKCNRISTIE